MSQNLSSKTFHGVKWTTSATLVNAVMQISYISVMAHMLEHDAFGIVAMSLMVVQLGKFFAQMGIGQAIVQKEEIRPVDIRAAFTMSVILCLSVFILFSLTAPLIALAFKSDDLAPVLRVSALALVANGLGSTSMSILRREMRFKYIAILNFTSYFLAYIVIGFTLAYLGFGYWSLVIANVSQGFVFTIGGYSKVRHSLIMTFNWDHYRPLFSYGSKMSVFQILSYFNGNTHTFFIGRFLGESLLGIFSQGYKLVFLPFFYLNSSLSGVLFPSFSRMQSDRNKLKTAYRSFMSMTGIILIPISMGIMVAAPEYVTVFLGKKWADSIPIVQISCVVVSMGLLNSYAEMVCDATATFKHKILLYVFNLILISIIFVLIRHQALIYFTWVLVLREIVKTTWYMGMMRKAIHTTTAEFFGSYVPGLIYGSVVAGGIYAVRELSYLLGVPIWAVFLLEIATGGILLALQVWMWPHNTLKQPLRMLLQKLKLERVPNRTLQRILHNYTNRLSHEIK